jgi:flavin reductase
MTQLSVATRSEDLVTAAPVEAPVTAGAFRDAMSRLAGGVAVAACWDGAVPRGLLISSICALSTEPPRVLFCVRKASSSHNALLRADRCGVAVLGEHDRAEADRFSRADLADERFDAARWSLEPHTPPRHRAPLIGLEGPIGHRIDAGTHTIFILNVREVRSTADRPLVYFDRDYRGLRLPGDLEAGLESLCGVTVWNGEA